MSLTAKLFSPFPLRPSCPTPFLDCQDFPPPFPYLPNCSLPLSLMFLLPRCLAAISSEPRPRYWCSASRVTRCSLQSDNRTRHTQSTGIFNYISLCYAFAKGSSANTLQPKDGTLNKYSTGRYARTSWSWLCSCTQKLTSLFPIDPVDGVVAQRGRPGRG